MQSEILLLNESLGSLITYLYATNSSVPNMKRLARRTRGRHLLDLHEPKQGRSFQLIYFRLVLKRSGSPSQ